MLFRSRVRIQVSRVDLDARKMDFRLVRDDALSLERPTKDHRATRGQPASARAELAAVQQRDRALKAQGRKGKKTAGASAVKPRGVVQKAKAAAKRKSRR